eukprot:TRINITY_DN2795_c0_g2_i1.p1 TRINITY_DN2795_c0_g2~~TRINITY_DN2795_c0_g2_i1.p1  ORF type:complete len:219 (+),score=30.14 TRINITY_DN2795_c0_g2_i1:20-676(+)
MFATRPLFAPIISQRYTRVVTSKPPRYGFVSPDRSALLVCDIQEKFRPRIATFPSVIHSANTLMQAAHRLEVPIIITEQHPKGLGNTVSELDTSVGRIFEKKRFSMLIPEVREYLKMYSPESIILVGIEAHACILQTAIELIEGGHEVHVVTDGTASQREHDRMVAFERMKQSGAFLTTTESVILQLLQSADHPQFKEIQNLLKVPPPPSGLEKLFGK